MSRIIALLAIIAVLTLSCDEEKNPQPTPPTAPNLLAAIEITHSSVRMTWNDRSNNEERFEVEKSTGTTWELAETVGANVTEAYVGGLNAGTPYQFRVFAVNNAGRSDASNTINVNTQSVNPPPAPTNVQANALAPYVVRVTWNDTAPNPVVFVIDRRTIETDWTRVGEAPDNATSFNDSTCLALTTYYYRVGARAGSLLTMSADSAQVTTPAVGTPAPPSNLQAEVILGTGVRLSWTDNSVVETSFQIGRNISGQPFGVIDTVPANTTVYFDSLGDAMALYNYGVRAANEVGASGWSNYVQANYVFCSEGAIPICLGYFWTYEVDPPSGPNYRVMRRIPRAEFNDGLDYYLVVQNYWPDSAGTDSLYYWRNRNDGLYQDEFPFDATPADLLLRVPASSGFWSFNGDSVIVTTSNVTVIVAGRVFSGVTIYQRFIRGTNRSIKYYLKTGDIGIIKEEEIEGSVIRTTREIVDWHTGN